MLAKGGKPSPPIKNHSLGNTDREKGEKGMIIGHRFCFSSGGES